MIVTINEHFARAKAAESSTIGSKNTHETERVIKARLCATKAEVAEAKRHGELEVEEGEERQKGQKAEEEQFDLLA